MQRWWLLGWWLLPASQANWQTHLSLPPSERPVKFGGYEQAYRSIALIP